MHLENLKILIAAVKEAPLFNWQDKNTCIDSISSKCFGVFNTYPGQSLVENLGITRYDAKTIVTANYYFSGDLTTWEQLGDLNKNSAIKLLNKCLELGRMPSVNEFEFTEEDFQ